MEYYYYTFSKKLQYSKAVGYDINVVLTQTFIFKFPCRKQKNNTIHYLQNTYICTLHDMYTPIQKDNTTQWRVYAQFLANITKY